jgi:hypothetical protein
MRSLADRPGLRTLAVGALLALVATGCVARPSPDPQRVVHEPRVVGGHIVDPGLAGQVDAVFAGYSFRNRRALIVNVDGWTVLRRQDQDVRRTPLPVEQIQGSILATLVGIAIDEGRLPGVDATLDQLLPQRGGTLSVTARALTLGQVLSIPPGRDQLVDPVATLSAVIEATGVPTVLYAQRALFDPLGLRSPANGLAATGAGAGEGLSLTARDLARLGQLWLDKGVWQGRRIVSASWVAAMTRARALADQAFGPGFGYQLWVTESDGHNAFIAAGSSGQLIEVVPELGLVVVAQSEPASRGSGRRGSAGPTEYANLVGSVIVPAITTSSDLSG